MKKLLFTSSLIASLIAAQTNGFAQNKLHVDASATGSNNGASWANAYTSLADAFIHADTVLAIDTVLIAEGVYLPEYHIDPSLTTDEYKGYIIKRGNLEFIGGYSAGGATLNPDMYKTILSGNIGSPTDSTDNVISVLYILGIGSQTIGNIGISNLTITGSYNVVANLPAGATYISNANTRFNNCTFSNNIGPMGGAIYMSDADLNITNSTFDNNNATIFADVIYASGSGAVNSNPLIFSNNIIKNNNALSPILVVLGIQNEGFIEGNIFSNNHTNNDPNSPYADFNSVLYAEQIYYTHISNNTFVNNTAKSAIMVISADSLSLQNNIISNNTLTNTDTIIGVNNVDIQKNYFQNNNSYPNNLSGNLNPMFVKYDTIFENGDFRLQFCSPLINAGNATNLQASTDFAGNARIVGSTVDIGAYEKQSDSIIANNAALSNMSDNGTKLLPTCEQDDWTFYAPLSNPDSIAFAIKWGTANATAKAAAEVNIQLDNAPTLVSNSNKGNATIARYWNINLNGTTLTNAIDVRFYHSQEEIDVVTDEFGNLGLDSILTTKWFVTPSTFTPSTQVGIDNINNGNITQVAAVINQINGIQFTEMSNITTNTSGTANISAYKKTTSISNNEFLNGLTLAPNPTTNMLNIQVLNQTFIGQKASLVDIHGRVLHSFELKANNQVDCSQLATGVYLIQVGSHNAAKFVKQ